MVAHARPYFEYLSLSQPCHNEDQISLETKKYLNMLRDRTTMILLRKLVGIIKGEEKRFAIFSSPEGRSVRYTEDTIVDVNLMILDIFDDHIYFKSNEKDNFYSNFSDSFNNI